MFTIDHSSSSSCARCHVRFEEEEWILRAEHSIYHLHCFTCQRCDVRLHPGDDYGIRDQLIFCREHFLSSSTSQFVLDDSGYYTSATERDLISSSSYLMDSQSNRVDPRRNKRLRTSFKHHQLRCLRSYFNSNHNPDGKELKSLSEKTSLSKRVLQVWFQNARAKYRRTSDDTQHSSTNRLRAHRF